MKHLAEPLESMMTARREVLTAKNTSVFRHGGGYALPPPEDVDLLLGTAVLAALERQRGPKKCRVVGEKTPENVFLFTRLKRLFPTAKFIGIARDPRDVLSSAWHFFPRPPPSDEVAAQTAFISTAFPALDNGARTMLALAQQFPADCINITYEQMRAATAAVATDLFRFLGVADGADLVADCVARTSFAALSGGRSPGQVQNGSFFRKGVVGDWRSTFTPEMSGMILGKLGWMYPHFGWTP